MNALHLNTQNIEEINLTINNFNTALNLEERNYENKDRWNSLGHGKVIMQRKGNVYLSEWSYIFHENVVIKPNEGMDGIIFYFAKKGGKAYGLNEKTNQIHNFPSNSSNIFFSHKECNNEVDFFKKDYLQENIGLHLPTNYFKQLVNLYPELFESSFLRYNKGETFFLKENFEPALYQTYNILSQIKNSHLMGNCANAYSDAKVLELLSLQIQYSEIKQYPIIHAFKNYDKIQEAESILLSNINNPPSVKQLALKVGLNEFDLRCGFKDFFNTTIYGHLFDHKMQLAQQFLQDSSKSITEVALDCGYNYPSHFCTAFKRKYGISPQQYQKS